MSSNNPSAMKYLANFRFATLTLTLFLFSIQDASAQRIKESGDLVTVSSDITDFDAISLSHQFEGEVIQSNGYGIELEIDENLEPYLRIRKQGRTLKLSLKNGVRYKGERPTFVIKMPVLTEIEASGATSAYLDGFNYDGEFEIDVSGASSVTGELSSKRLTIDTSGASKVQLEGEVDEIVIDASGASNIDLDEMRAHDVRVDVSGASSARVNCDGELRGDASGVSNIRYEGNPERVNVQTSGLSKIRKI